MFFLLNQAYTGFITRVGDESTYLMTTVNTMSKYERTTIICGIK